MMIAAFDLSLTATGFARTTGDSVVEVGLLSPPKQVAHGTERLRWIRSQVLGLADGAALVALEGYSFGSPNRAHQMGELGGVIRVALADRGQLYAEVPPASLKLFATGRGNAKKEEMLAAAIKQLYYDGHDHNEADALWLLRAATTAAGAYSAKNDHQRRAIAKVHWSTGAPDGPPDTWAVTV